jgi:hypothetical protein
MGRNVEKSERSGVMWQVAPLSKMKGLSARDKSEREAV